MEQNPIPQNVKTTFFTFQCTFNAKMPILMQDSENIGQYQPNDA